MKEKMYLVFASIFWGILALMLLLRVLDSLPVDEPASIILGAIIAVLAGVFTFLMSGAKAPHEDSD